jgi:hypothetical protein
MLGYPGQCVVSRAAYTARSEELAVLSRHVSECMCVCVCVCVCVCGVALKRTRSAQCVSAVASNVPCVLQICIKR